MDRSRTTQGPRRVRGVADRTFVARERMKVWDVNWNQNGGVYHPGLPHDAAFRQTVAESFLTNPHTTRAATARRFKCSEGFVSIVVSDMLTYQSLATFDYGGSGREPALQFEDLAYLDVLVQQNPRDHIWQHRLHLNQDLGLHVSLTTVQHAVKNILGYSYKVLESIASERDTPEIRRQTVAYIAYMQMIDIHRVAFFDETGVNQRTANARYGRGLRGRAGYVSDPHKWGCNHTILATIALGLPVMPWGVHGGAKGDDLITYFLWLTPILVNAGIEVVVMDNCRTHYDPFLRILLNGSGIRLVFLPRYSPYLNPIELVFGKLKHLLRFHRGAIQSGNVFATVAECLLQISQQNLQGFYRKCGYTP